MANKKLEQSSQRKKFSTKSWKPALPPFRKYKKEVYLQHAETAKFIYQIGEGDIVRQKSAEVSTKDIHSVSMKAKTAYLKKCLLKYRKVTGKGRGIAAIQIGIPERFAVILMPDRKEKIIGFHKSSD